jgi:hypothetical protein
VIGLRVGCEDDGGVAEAASFWDWRARPEGAALGERSDLQKQEQGLRRHNRVECQATAYQSIQCTQSRPQAIYKQPPLLLDSSQLLDK